LIGSGTLTAIQNTNLTPHNANFSGNMGGDLNLVVTGDAQLYGSTTVGGVAIGNGSNVADIVNNIGATFICDASSSIVENSGSTSGYFINDGTFVRNGLGGDTTVSVPFFNHGTVIVTTGSVTFTAGFFNDGTVKGTQTTNPDGSVTLTACCRPE
jgi:hypothetical protein